MQKNNFLIILVIVVIFGFAAGIVGEIIARVYLLDKIYGVPMFGEISLGNNPYNKPNLIISGAKKVVVENNEKINETINTASNSLVGIFNKKQAIPYGDGLNLYIPNQSLGQGLIITSDGWLISGMTFNEDTLNDYVVVTNEKDIYEIDKVIKSIDLPIVFIHLRDVNNLSVKQFTEKQNLRIGNTVVAMNWLQTSLVDSISDLYFKKDGLIKSSDDFIEKIKISNKDTASYKNFFVFDLSGNLIGLLNDKGEVFFINDFISLFQSVPESGKIKKVTFGVNYIPFSQLIIKDNKYLEGALIYKNKQGISVVAGSPADKAGLKENDIITTLNGVKIDANNDLSDIIQGYSPGDTVEVSYLRDGINKNVKIKLE